LTNDLPIENFMQRDLLECAPDLVLGDAARLMRDARCGSILIVENGALLGIWTETDALTMAWDTPAVLERPIREFMSTPVKTIAASATLGETAFCMRGSGIRHVVVINEAGRPVGMISQTDVIRHQGVEFFVSVREVGTVVQQAPLVIASTASLSEARRQMAAQRSDAMVVVGEDGAYGIITSRDVLHAAAERCVGARVGELASFPLLTVQRTASLFAARKLFLDRHIRHLGVCAEQQVVGLLSFNDIMGGVEEGYIRELRAELRQQTEQLRHTEWRIKEQTGMTEAVFDALPISVLVRDAKGTFLIANKMAGEILGKPRDEIIGRSDRDLLPAETVRCNAEDDARARAAGQTLTREMKLADGRVLIAHKRAVQLNDSSYLIDASIDVTNWKRADSLMLSSHHVLELIVGGADLPVVLNAICQRMEVHLPQSRCSILLLDEDNRLRVSAAPSIAEAYLRGIDGIAIGPQVGSCGTAAFLGEQVIVEDIAISPLWQIGGKHALKHGLRACWSTPFFSSERKVLGTFAIYFGEPRAPKDSDLEVITHATRLASLAVERWRQIADLRRMATTDLLTGLPNRADFFDRAAEELRRAGRFDRPPALLMMDLDRFKRINDRFGHGAGDEALRAFSRVLAATMREIDIVGRVGGEEFAAILPETDIKGAILAAERLRVAVEALRVPLAGNESLSFTVSIGIAIPKLDEPIDRLMARADAALYAAKDNGRNRVECAGGMPPSTA
jgi:diguanylate cyclase (GGDEF)-like protein